MSFCTLIWITRTFLVACVLTICLYIEIDLQLDNRIWVLVGLTIIHRLVNQLSIISTKTISPRLTNEPQPSYIQLSRITRTERSIRATKPKMKDRIIVTTN
jgi:hypothetical protein